MVSEAACPGCRELALCILLVVWPQDLTFLHVKFGSLRPSHPLFP